MPIIIQHFVFFLDFHHFVSLSCVRPCLSFVQHLWFSLFFRANRGMTLALCKLTSPGENHEMAFLWHVSVSAEQRSTWLSGDWLLGGYFSPVPQERSLQIYCEERWREEGGSQELKYCWKEVCLFLSELCGGHDRGRDLSRTQMCKADRNSGYLANKRRKREDKVGRRQTRQPTLLLQTHACAEIFHLVPLVRARWRSRCSTGAELLFISTSSVSAKHHERLLCQRLHITAVHLPRERKIAAEPEQNRPPRSQSGACLTESCCSEPLMDGVSVLQHLHEIISFIFHVCLKWLMSANGGCESWWSRLRSRPAVPTTAAAANIVTH